MDVGGFAVDSHVGGFSGRITLSVVIMCIVAASGGLLFGYDIGISGALFFSFVIFGFRCHNLQTIQMFWRNSFEYMGLNKGYINNIQTTQLQCLLKILKCWEFSISGRWTKYFQTSWRSLYSFSLVWHYFFQLQLISNFLYYVTVMLNYL